MNKRIIIAFFCFYAIQSLAQVNESFDDGNLTAAPTWVGDLDNFIVNDDLEMQLMAPAAGQSQIGLQTMFTDSVVWEIYFNMKFAPSENNKLTIILWQDQNSGTTYLLDIGENGADDAIQFKEITSTGMENFIASATLGAIANDPAKARIKMSKTAEDLWTLGVDYGDDSAIEEEFMIQWPTQDMTGMHYFGFECLYSSTRTDKFYFDDIVIGPLLPDTQGPIITQVDIIGNNEILICYDESIDNDTGVDINNYTLNNSISPTSAQLVSNNKVRLSFGPFLSGIDYTLMVSNISDELGNISAPQTYSFFVTETPTVGDLVVNEILFDPLSGGPDFIEIYNKSDKTLDINGLILVNTQKSDQDAVSQELIMQPDSYYAFTNDKEFILDNYQVLDASRIIEMAIPSFNNDAGNVSLRFDINNVITTIDSFDYLESFHFPLLDDTEGVSLERIDPNTDSNISDNWHSASSIIGYATPGYRNSNYLNLDPISEFFTIEETTFSPNQDGDNDVLVVSYNLDDPSYLATVKIYDAQGRKIRELLNNELLSTNGFVKWDGVNDEGILAKVGIYIVLFEIFTPEGNTSQFKKAVVLADFL